MQQNKQGPALIIPLSQFLKDIGATIKLAAQSPQGAIWIRCGKKKIAFQISTAAKKNIRFTKMAQQAGKKRLSELYPGLDSHRLAFDNNHPESTFAKQWIEENSGCTTHPLPALCGNLSNRDIAVAATIIQWLGSNVGACFIRTVVKKNPKLQEYLRGVITPRQ